MKHKPKTCLHCGKSFIPYTSVLKMCSINCALEYNREHNRVVEYIKAREERDWKKKKKILKAKLKTHKDWLKDLEKVFNEYIRIRDQGLPCISCGTTADVEYHAGHYYAAGNYSYLRFDEQNVNRQCGAYCNKFKRGNFPEYTEGIIKKYGAEVVARLKEQRHLKLKLSIPEIQGKIGKYRELIKQLKKAA